MQTKKILKQKMSDADEFEKFEQVVSETEQKYGALLEDDKFPNQMAIAYAIANAMGKWFTSVRKTESIDETPILEFLSISTRIFSATKSWTF